MDYKKSYLILLFGLWGGIAISLLGMLTQVQLFAYIGYILLIGSFLQTFLFYKCPNCGKQLNIRGKMPQYCPECGSKLT